MNILKKKQKELMRQLWSKQGLYSPEHEHSSCGVGFVANIDGIPSRTIIENALELNCKIEHRGAIGADPKTGDGAGLLLQIPHKFFNKVCKKNGIILPDSKIFGVGFFFFPEEEKLRESCKKIISKVLDDESFELLGWREVPVNKKIPGKAAKMMMPSFWQCFVTQNDDGVLDEDSFERKLYMIRRVIDYRIRTEMKLSSDEYYVSSFSGKTIVYKGMLLGDQFQNFYRDLSDPDFISAIALVHMRFSTNTFPSWPLAQPFRYIAHNGEINTLRGNKNRMKARQAVMESPYFGADLKRMLPIMLDGQSDSACFDLILELLYLSGRSLPHAVMMMVPEAWSKDADMDEELRAFYEYHAMIMEPWDGPAAITFTDGRYLGVTLDRNGLRPARYVISKDGMVIMASEIGGIYIPEDKILRHGKIEPGKMFLLDVKEKKIFSNREIKESVSCKQLYKKWVQDNTLKLSSVSKVSSINLPSKIDKESLRRLQKAFGYTKETIFQILKPMIENAKEPIGSMGVDASLAVLSKNNPTLFHYFKQLFAQVTNPPIDAIRESLVMELTTYIGPERNLLGETPEHAQRLELHHPVLTNEEMAKVKEISDDHFRSETLSLLFSVKGKHEMRHRLDVLCQEAKDLLYKKDINLLILSDRGVSKDFCAIPSLLAVSAVHHFLIREGIRTKTGILIETAEPVSVFEYALLCGYGANAINPYLSFDSISQMVNSNFIDNKSLSVEELQQNYLRAIELGLFKIFSKMGISALQSYCGAQIFEAIGLDAELIDKYFTGTTSPLDGISLENLAEETLKRHMMAFSDKISVNQLPIGGLLHYRVNGENHLWTSLSIVKLQQATQKNDFTLYKEYAKLINNQDSQNVTLRSLLDFRNVRKKIPLSKVESATEIVKRFSTGAMSYGSISWEAHTNLAIAMNRIGAKSNTGEGGEDPIRFKTLKNGDSMRSAIKQVASGRFGVTSNYLANADEIQIKIAQGAKPGEGGQLPGIKVDSVIARVRYSTEGVTLISPPPHHDIYSIEDLKQLIFDLKNSNPNARISVKLVSEVGVGTIAAGVVKAHADHIVIAGHDGGTGASPISSIHHTGSPWELGLSETHQTLMLNGLRDRVCLATDGQLKTGRDVVLAALMGAEEFGFSTTALVTQGCIMMRKCHLNTCPVGVATQDKELREKFRGKPEYLVNFMLFIAEEVREIMAELGYVKFHDLVGQVDLIKSVQSTDHKKANTLDFRRLLYKPEPIFSTDLYCTKKQNHEIDLQIDNEWIEKSQEALHKKRHVEINSKISSINRTAGTLLSYTVTSLHGEKGLPDDTIIVNLEGTAGQSFGAFMNHGITLNLLGVANDYVGKGLSGGKIIIKISSESLYEPSTNYAAGNICLYGATSGELYINGRAGERFAIRNSGAHAIVEGIGDHGCEYMTGGLIVILGEIGQNFAAGMSGGIAAVWDPKNILKKKMNMDMVECENLADTKYVDSVHVLVQNHERYTHSKRARYILHDWDDELNNFKLVMPLEYKKALEKLTKLEEENESFLLNPRG